jgi:hypothetical protein
MNNEYLMNVASILFLLFYVSEIYSNYIDIKINSYNKNNNLFKKIILLSGNTFAVSYSIKINNISLIFNYSSLFGLDIIILIMDVYYFYKNKNQNLSNTTHNIENQKNPIHTSINEIFSDYSICYV